MTQTPVRETHRGIKRKDLISSLGIGVVLGLIPGSVLGWFAHDFYADQQRAQVLVCRENNRNLTAAQLEARCGLGF